MRPAGEMMSPTAIAHSSNESLTFLYANIADGAFVSSKGFQSAKVGDWIHLMLRGFQPSEYPNKNETLGWKFHLTFADVPATNITAGWNAIMPILIKHKVFNTKLPARGTDMTAGHDVGRHITIYAFQDNKSPEQWNVILNEMTDALIKTNVKAGPPPDGPHFLPGSSYITYRNDKSLTSSTKYTPSGFNLSGEKDPYEGKIKITVPHPEQLKFQAEKPKFSAEENFANIFKSP